LAEGGAVGAIWRGVCSQDFGSAGRPTGVIFRLIKLLPLPPSFQEILAAKRLAWVEGSGSSPICSPGKGTKNISEIIFLFTFGNSIYYQKRSS
jgi:hypothetical protein